MFPQTLDTFIKEVNLENSLRNKIYSELERNFDKNDRFVVIVNLEIGRYGDLTNESNDENRSNANIRKWETLPGVPLSGSKGNNAQQTSPRQANVNDSVISEIDIEVWVEPTFNNEQMLESLIKGVIPDLAPCDNCVRIQAMNFNTQSNKEDSEFEKLKKELEGMKEQARKDEMTELNLQLADLKAQLEDSDDELMGWKDYLGRTDSLRLVQLEEEREKEFQDNKEKVNQAYEDAMANKKAGATNTNSGEMEGAKDGSIWDWLIPTLVFLIVLSVIAFLMIMINKKSVVYLKPKGDNNSNSSNEKSTNGSDEPTPSINNPGPPSGTAANVDESVLSSELKALRQSSIAMSASQKQGATQIVKDWMDDGNPQNNDEANEGGE